MAEFVRLASVADLPPGGALEVEHDGHIYALFNIDGVISAIDGICAHQGGPLADGPLRGSMVTCPWHGWQFDVRTGVTPVSSKIRQRTFEVQINNQDVLVAVA